MSIIKSKKKIFSSVFIVSLCLAIFVSKTMNTSTTSLNTVTEYFSGMNYPDPYSLKFVTDYKFVLTVGEFLVRQDKSKQIVPGLAKDWKISSDRRKITFYLREGIYSAEEVAQSLKRLVKHGQTAHSNFSSQTNENNIRVIDDITLEIETFGDAGAIIQPLIMADAAILPNKVWREDANGNAFVDWSKVNGPYTWESGEFPISTSNAVVFKPNPDHYLYKSDQTRWRITIFDFDKYDTLEKLNTLLRESPGIFTLTDSEIHRLIHTRNPGIKFVNSKYNGIFFLMFNLNSPIFRSEKARKYIAKRILETEIPLSNPDSRAFQIPQPGLTGRLEHEQLDEVLTGLRQASDYEFDRPLTWRVSNKSLYRREWVENLARAIGIPSSFVEGSLYDKSGDWASGKIDMQLQFLGMSETDPISSASFLFSPSGAGLDLSDGQILKMLNSAKHTADPRKIDTVVKQAFRLALEHALVVPIHYSRYRHFHSNNVRLNIEDVFDEIVHIESVRVD